MEMRIPLRLSPLLLIPLLIATSCSKDDIAAVEEEFQQDTTAVQDSLPVDSSGTAQLPCNGHPEICDRRIDEVFFAMTHNSHAHDGAYSGLSANQNGDVTAQLAAGVRGLNIKPYMTQHGNCGDGSEGLYLYHGSPILGCEPFLDYLTDLRGFLDCNPRECVIMTIEGSANMQQLDSIFDHAALRPYMYGHGGGQWPTLAEMIASNRRLVVLADRSSAESHEGFHRMWHHTVDVNYNIQNTSQFDCDFDRGNPSGAFFLLNHFLTNITPQPNSAAQTNAYGLLYPRALECWQANGKRPNFIMVDFYATGDVVQVVDSLNLLH